MATKKDQKPAAKKTEYKFKEGVNVTICSIFGVFKTSDKVSQANLKKLFASGSKFVEKVEL